MKLSEALVATVLFLFSEQLSSPAVRTVRADPGFSCRDNLTNKYTIVDLQGYVECGSSCTCSAFEVMCLVKSKDAG